METTERVNTDIIITEQELKTLCLDALDKLYLEDNVKHNLKEDMEYSESYLIPDKERILKLILKNFESMVYNRAAEYEQFEYENTVEDLTRICDNYNYIMVVSTCGRWNGRYSCIPTIHTSGKDVMNRILGNGGFDKIEFDLNNEKILTVTGIHHDGSNCYYVLPFNVDNDSIQIEKYADPDLIIINQLIKNNILTEEQVNIIQKTLNASTNLKVCSCS